VARSRGRGEQGLEAVVERSGEVLLLTIYPVPASIQLLTPAQYQAPARHPPLAHRVSRRVPSKPCAINVCHQRVP
jgi:hypothetical protein